MNQTGQFMSWWSLLLVKFGQLETDWLASLMMIWSKTLVGRFVSCWPNDGAVIDVIWFEWFVFSLAKSCIRNLKIWAAATKRGGPRYGSSSTQGKFEGDFRICWSKPQPFAAQFPHTLIRLVMENRWKIQGLALLKLWSQQQLTSWYINGYTCSYILYSIYNMNTRYTLYINVYMYTFLVCIHYSYPHIYIYIYMIYHLINLDGSSDDHLG